MIEKPTTVSENQPQEFKRSLTWIDGTFIVMGSMIGSGIFLVSAEMARYVGGAGWLMLLWLISGLITVIGALTYGELGGMLPLAGGQFIYIKRAYNSFFAFLWGWGFFMVEQTGTIAAVAVAFARYVGFFIPGISTQNYIFDGFIKVSTVQILAIVMIVTQTFINTRGIESGKWIQSVFTSAKTIALFLLIALGLIVANPSHLAENFKDAWHFESQPGMITWHDAASSVGLVLVLGTAIIGALFSSTTWSNVTFIAGELKNPKRDIPLSLAVGTLTVTVLYFLANIAYLNLLPLHGNSNGANDVARGIMFAKNDLVGTAAASQIFEGAAPAIMAILVIISTFGCNSGMILSGARVTYAMAKEGLFFKKTGELNKAQVPAFALWIQCAWASLLCLSGTYSALLDYVIFVSLLFWAITAIGIFILRIKEPNLPRPYRVWGYPILPALFIFLCLSICSILLITKTENSGRGLLILLIGIPFYFLLKKRGVTN